MSNMNIQGSSGRPQGGQDIASLLARSAETNRMRDAAIIAASAAQALAQAQDPDDSEMGVDRPPAGSTTLDDLIIRLGLATQTEGSSLHPGSYLPSFKKGALSEKVAADILHKFVNRAAVLMDKVSVIAKAQEELDQTLPKNLSDALQASLVSIETNDRLTMQGKDYTRTLLKAAAQEFVTQVQALRVTAELEAVNNGLKKIKLNKTSAKRGKGKSPPHKRKNELSKFKGPKGPAPKKGKNNKKNGPKPKGPKNHPKGKHPSAKAGNQRSQNGARRNAARKK
ncbi:hypothetical protein KI688_000001 [Linnemannia hyalina]|uniref:Uncharacterized protein n=1 Tax=Linnemannia hyalina TaxID=64524 RepID=A0A9P7XII4_9FUNG|nr:hypothetical protein KI688_009766 [Linnemannia hyalina]KAG9060721.1 hypothetical protein KI688_009767 [Linnemannia hyalina]KAG9060737.1 hypothetical protein KI688_008914 [Linnemannia hyalina]KAG9060763.1 hypothetical protein KI688_008881 [Linnemannia hyalina]KAG9069640.1 hypothetical protein KI688_010544 [Linnemannia hyalina]